MCKQKAEMYIYFNKAKVKFYIARQENAGRKLSQDVIQLLQRQHKESLRLPDSFQTPFPFRKIFKKLPHSTPL